MYNDRKINITLTLLILQNIDKLCGFSYRLLSLLDWQYIILRSYSKFLIKFDYIVMFN